MLPKFHRSTSRFILRIRSWFTKKMSSPGEDWLEMDEVCVGSPGASTDHHLNMVDYLPTNNPAPTLLPVEESSEMFTDPSSGGATLHIMFPEVLVPLPGEMAQLSRPDSQNGSTSSTFQCDGDEGDAQFALCGTLGSYTHPLMGGSLVSIYACRGDEAHSLMCGSVTTSRIACNSPELADFHLYGEQLRLCRSIAAQEGACRGDEALRCGPVTTSRIACNSPELADFHYHELKSTEILRYIAIEIESGQRLKTLRTSFFICLPDEMLCCFNEIKLGMSETNSEIQRCKVIRERLPFLPKGIKVHTLNPCIYLLNTLLDGTLLNSLLLDGRCKCKCSCKCKYLDTYVLDGRKGKSLSDTKIRRYDVPKLPSYKVSKLQIYDEIESGLKVLPTSSFICLPLKTLRTSIFICQALKTSYDTSSLKRKQLVIDGDVESNPGPISSVEGYRAAIGRFSGKFKKKEKVASCKGLNMAFYLFIMMLISILIYALAVGIMFIYQAFIPVLILYGCSLSIFCFCIDLFSIQFQKMLRKDVLMRKSLTDNTLVQFRNVDAYVIDGRIRSSIQLCLENGRISRFVFQNAYIL